MRFLLFAPWLLSLSCAGAPHAAPLAAATMYRGNPQLTGTYGAAAVRSIAGVRFAFRTGGPIRSAPAVVGGLLYFGSGDGSFYALDAVSGAQRWRFVTGGAVHSSPAVAWDNVYFASRDGFLYALDAATGRRRWAFHFGRDRGDQNYWDYFLSSPSVVGRTLFIGSGDGSVYALDARSGALRWRFDAGARVRATPAVSGDTLVAATMAGIVYALDTRDGRLRWKFATQGAANAFADNGNDTTAISASPSISDGVVAVGGRDAFVYGLDLRDGSLRWRTTHDGSSWILATAVDAGTLYVGSGSATLVQAADLATGAEKWRHKTRGAVFASLTLAGDVLYVADFSGSLEAIDKASGARLWSYPLSGRVLATPVVADGIVYCGADDGTMTALAGSVVAAPGAGVPRKRVYWQGRKSDKAFSWFQNGVDGAILDYFRGAGYEQVDARQLAEFMGEEIARPGRSVVVFADNRIPADVVEEISARALIRRYLDAGGKVAFLGPNPLAYRLDPDTGVVDDIDYKPVEQVFGVRYPPLQRVGGYYASRTTAEGERWGLSGIAVSAGAIEPGEASGVLAQDEFGMASAWYRSYGGAPGTGLLQLNLPRMAPTDYAPYRAAIEHGLE